VIVLRRLDFLAFLCGPILRVIALQFVNRLNRLFGRETGLRKRLDGFHDHDPADGGNQKPHSAPTNRERDMRWQPGSFQQVADDRANP
jgi:hypothetical protein